MEALTQKIVKVLEIVLIILMASIVLDVTWQVVTRFILQNPSSFTEELAGFLLIWIGLLGSSYAVYTKAHLGIDVLARKLEFPSRRILEIVVYTIILLFALFIPLIGGLRLVNITFSLRQISPSMGLAMGYVYLVLPLTGILMIFFALVHILRAAKAKTAPAGDEPHINIFE
jgi:TRAP-type C4-dicarboxylate transport system permease small subunit